MITKSVLKAITKRLYTKRLQAGALQYVLFISIIAGLFCGLFIIAMYQSGRMIDDEAIRSSLRSEVNSAIVYSLNHSTVASAKTELDLFEDTPYKTYITWNNWGIYKILTAEASQNSITAQKHVLVGQASPDLFTTAMYVPNNIQYISAAGKTVIKGNCFLPKNGIRPEYTGNEGFIGDSLPYGKVMKSDENMPEIFTESIEAMYSAQGNADSITAGNIDDLESNEIITNSFSRPVIIYTSSNNITLSCRLISGNIIISSDSLIEVTSACRLHNVILFAPYIIIDKDVSGSFQAFAKKKIEINEGADILFPSAFVLLDKENAQTNNIKTITIKEHATVRGTVVLLSKKQFNNYSRVIIDKDATLYGFLYSNNRTEINGTLYGSVYTESFFLQTPYSIYENLLKNAVIDVRKLPRTYANGFVLKKMDRLKEINVLK